MKETLWQVADAGLWFLRYAAENPVEAAPLLLGVMFIPMLLLRAVAGRRRSDAERAAEKEWASRAEIRREGLVE